MKGLKVTKIFEEIKFEGFCRELEPKIGFQRQSFIKYLGLTLVLMRNKAVRVKFHFCFLRFFR